MSDELNRLIRNFSSGGQKSGESAGASGSGELPRPSSRAGMSAFLKPSAPTPAAGKKAAETPQKPAPRAEKKKPAPRKAPPAAVPPAEGEWELPADMRKGTTTPVKPAPVEPAFTPVEPAIEPDPVHKEPKATVLPRRKPEKDPIEPAYATVETAGACPAVEPPLRGGHVGRVLNLQEIPEDDIPPKLTRWFTSLLTGAPYVPTNSGVIFYLQPEEGDPDGRVYQVTAYGNLGLANHMRLCVQGRSESSGTIVAHRIERDASVDPAHPDWSRVSDRRSRSALSLWVIILAVVFLGYMAFQGLILPLIAWLIAYGAELLVWIILILIIVFIFRGRRRGRRGWF